MKIKKFKTLKNIFTEDIMYAMIDPKVKEIDGVPFIEVFKTKDMTTPFFMRKDAFKEMKGNQ